MYFQEIHNLSEPWERLPIPPPTAHKCGGKGCDRMLPLERAYCRSCRPAQPVPGYSRPDVRALVWNELPSISRVLEQLGLVRGPQQ